MAQITSTTVANIALRELGAARITNLNDGSKNAVTIKDVYDVALEYTLALHPWNFAIKRVKDQAELGSKPEWGWDHAYSVPTDSLRVLGIGKEGVDIDAPYAIESDMLTGNRIIVTNVDAPIDIKYIFNNTNHQLYSPTFIVALVKVVKWFVARPITGRKEFKDEAKAELDEFMKRSMSTDGQEGTSEEYAPTDLEDVR